MQLDPSLYLPLAGAVIAAIAGIGLRMWVGRRAFYRRNAAGVEEFKSYSSKIASGFLESAVNAVGLLLIAGGVIYAISIIMKIKV